MLPLYEAALLRSCGAVEGPYMSLESIDEVNGGACSLSIPACRSLGQVPWYGDFQFSSRAGASVKVQQFPLMVLVISSGC